jgi:probable blue pigment (indigoidine) exporter
MNPKLCAAIAAAIWGTTYIMAALVLPANPVFCAAVRSLAGGFALLLLSPRLPTRDWVARVVLLGTLNCGIFFSLFFVSAERLPGGIAGTLQSLGPIFVVLIAWPVLGERPTIMRLASVVCGAFGVTLLTRGGVAVDVIGLAAGLGAAASLALGNVLLNRWTRPASLLQFTAWQLVVGGIELAALTVTMGDIPAGLTTQNLLGFAYTALIGTCAAYALWFKAVEEAGAPTVAPFFLLIPIVAFTIDALWRSVLPTPVQAIGAAVVLASLAAGQIFGARARDKR